MDDAFAHELYGALCNMRWRRRDADGELVSMSWRYAGDVVAHLACKGGCYLDYYCSGNEGSVSAGIRDALGALGWISLRGRRTKGEQPSYPRSLRTQGIRVKVPERANSARGMDRLHDETLASRGTGKPLVEGHDIQ